MKEFQKTHYFAAYEHVFSSGGSSMTNAKQQEKQREYVFGNRNPDYMTLTEQMVLGINQFVGLYDEVPIAITDDSYTSANKNITAGAQTKDYSTYHKKSDFDLELKAFFSQRKLLEGHNLPS